VDVLCAPVECEFGEVLVGCDASKVVKCSATSLRAGEQLEEKEVGSDT